MVATPRRRRVRWSSAIAGTALAVAVGLTAWTAWELHLVRRDLDTGQGLLRSLSVTDLDRIDEITEEASSRLDRARARLTGSPVLGALRSLPGIGAQVRGAGELTRVAADLGGEAEAAGRVIAAALEDADRPAGRVELLSVTEQELDRLARAVRATAGRLPDDLVGPLASARRSLASALAEGAVRLDDAGASVGSLHDMLAGRRTLLLLAANNAEMAAGAGLALTAGRLEIDRGSIELTDVVQAGELRLEAPVEAPPHLAAVYDTVGIGLDLRSTTRSPDLRATGPVAAAVAEANGWTVDGVLVVDAVALSELVRATGPVEIGGRTLGPEALLAELLHEGYRRADQTGDPAARVASQHSVARAVVASLQRPDLDLGRLAGAIVEAAQGRHVLAWADDPAQQATWERLGVTGALPQDGLLLSFQNHAANKLDWYLRPSVALDVGRLPSGDWRARITMRMVVPHLADLEGATPYILGPDPGRHEVLLTAHLPVAARDITTTDPAGFHRQGTDGGLPVRTFLVSVEAGQELERTIELTLPSSVRSVALVPSARLEPVSVTVDGVVTVDDARPRRLSWVAAVLPPAGPSRPERVAAGVLLVGVGAALGLRLRRLGPRKP
jgi:hypothetical protein